MAVTSKEQFVQFLEDLRIDLGSGHRQWENATLSDFLESMQAWVKDMDGYYANLGIKAPSNVDWQSFADILNGAKDYE